MANLVKLPSGMILDADRIVFMGKDSKNIGSWIVFLEGSQGAAPFIDGTDLDALVSGGYIRPLNAPPLIQS